MIEIRSGAARDATTVGPVVARRAALFDLGFVSPDGFFVSQEAWSRADRQEALEQSVRALEARTSRKLGDPSCLLLLAVRPAGGRPVLCVGAPPGLGALEPRRFHLELERRFVSSLAAHRTKSFVAEPWSQLLAESLREAGAETSSELDTEELARLVSRGRAALASDVREEPLEQLAQVIEAVGAPVLVTEVIFGNADDRSGCGFASSHDEETGEQKLTGMYFAQSLGDEGGPGGRPALPLDSAGIDVPTLSAMVTELESRLRRPARLEFVIERGRIHAIDSAPLEMRGPALVRALVELTKSGRIRAADAIEAATVSALDSVVRTAVTPVDRTVLAKGLAASPGSASGALVLSAAEAEARGHRGEAAIYVTRETMAEDVAAIVAARGVVTGRGGLTSHAAVVARSVGRPAIVGAFELAIDPGSRSIRARGRVVREGETISIEPATGEILLGEAVAWVERSPQFDELLSMADEAAVGIGIRAIASSVDDVEHGSKLGARGVGWLRTERMLRKTPSGAALAAYLIATDEPMKAAMLERLRVDARERYSQVLAAAGGPVAFGLLDTSASLVLSDQDALAAAAGLLGAPVEAATGRAQSLLQTRSAGWRGARFLLREAAVFRAQVRAICEALATRVASGHAVRDEILVPFVSDPRELAAARAVIDEVSAEILSNRGRARVGVLVSIPRAAALWAELSREADLMVVDLPGLTAWSFGLLPGDALPPATVSGDPFATLDAGVARLLPRERRGPFAIVGSQTTDPAVLISFPGAEWIASAPARVPAARLSAAKASLRVGRSEATL
ncbi:MAG: hypothetical protein HYV07_03775 [Deltaproteobacteria bacterium]|nr:hypothetical protein [Deltaproteobacteria bacterium]